MSDPDRHLRNLQIDLAARLGRMGAEPPDSTASFLGRVFAETAIPTTAQRYVMVHPVEIDGGQEEGDVPTFTADPTRSIAVLPLGDAAPVAGDYLDVFAVGGRWVAETGCGDRDDDCPGGGTLCVTLASVCSGNGNGYSVVVKAHGSGTVVATGTTTSGTVCFTLPPGAYDVTATRTGCSSFSWPNLTVTCGVTTTANGTAACSTGGAIIFTVRGCSRLVEGVVITMSGAGSGSVTTASDGTATFFTGATGSFTVTATHPSGRWATTTTTVTKGNTCTPVSENLFLTPASGYVCCTSTAYPIKNTLYLTIGDGAHVVQLGGYVHATNAAVSPVLIPGSPANCAGSAALNVLITVACDSFGSVSVAIRWGELNKYTPCFFSDAYVQYSAFVPGTQASSVKGSGTPTTSPPFAASGTVSPVLPNSSVLGDPTATSAWTLTE